MAMPEPPEPAPADRGALSTATHPRGRRWLLFVHQLPSHPSNLRVSTWRRLQQLGAIPLKQAVYVLPDTPGAREDFEWLKTEVRASGGDASVFAADNVDAWSDDALVEEFRRSRSEAYAALVRDVEQIIKRAGVDRRPRGTRAPALRRLLDTFRERLAAVDAIDFFGSRGREKALALLQKLEDHVLNTHRPGSSSVAPVSKEAAAHQARLWITRPRPGVDRMASAWLIRRFIDPKARFGFAADQQAVPTHGVPFDMFGVDFSHQGGGCTFETLCAVFGLREPALSRIAAIVHDLDLKDAQFGAPECPTVGAIIEGLRLAYQDDDALLAQGMTLFDSLYRSFAQAAHSDTASVRPQPKQKTLRSRKAGRSRKDR